MEINRANLESRMLSSYDFSGSGKLDPMTDEEKKRQAADRIRFATRMGTYRHPEEVDTGETPIEKVCTFLRARYNNGTTRDRVYDEIIRRPEVIAELASGNADFPIERIRHETAVITGTGYSSVFGEYIRPQVYLDADTSVYLEFDPWVSYSARTAQAIKTRGAIFREKGLRVQVVGNDGAQTDVVFFPDTAYTISVGQAIELETIAAAQGIRLFNLTPKTGEIFYASRLVIREIQERAWAKRQATKKSISELMSRSAEGSNDF